MRARVRAAVVVGRSLLILLACFACDQAALSQGTRGSRNIRFEHSDAGARDARFAHLTTNDGLSQSTVTDILQDRHGFMWFATRDGLNRYDGNTFVVYKHNPKDPGTLSVNDIWDLMEDDQGYLWIATIGGGVNRFDPLTERFTRYRHDDKNPKSIAGDAVLSIAPGSDGNLWFGTLNRGLDKFDRSTGTFTHYMNDSDGRFLGRITKVIRDSHNEIWFVGDRGLFHLNSDTGLITHASASADRLSADFLYEDNEGNLWMLAYSPIVGLVKYDRLAQRITKYPIGAGASGVADSKLLDDGANGLWVSSSLGLYHFDRRAERLTRIFRHDDTDPNSLSDDRVVSLYEDRGGVLWVGTENGGLNLLSARQEQFGLHRHHPGDANSLSPGKVSAIYKDLDGTLWIGFSPRALDKFDRKTGKMTHYVPRPGDKDSLGEGSIVNSIYRDSHGYLWVGGCCSGLERFDQYTGRFKHYRPNSSGSNSLISDIVRKIYGDRNGHLWLGEAGGVTCLDPVTERFTNYRSAASNSDNPSTFGSTARAIYQDRSGTLWFGIEGTLSRLDDKTRTLVNNSPDSHDPQRLQGGVIITIHEDRAGTLWLGTWDGLYSYNRQNGTFTRYTERQGLPSSVIQGILEDKTGKLWLSTKKGISRFDPENETFRNYDVSDGLQADEFSEGAYAQGQDGEMFFGGTGGFNAFFPENVGDNAYVPPVVITSLKIFNKLVQIGPHSVLTKAIPYTDSLVLSYRDNIFSFEFAALSYANSNKNRYRYKLEGLESSWNEVGSKQRVATYTNLDPKRYVFRVQGSNSDGVWNDVGVALRIVIQPPWWSTNWFRTLCAAAFLALLWTAYQFRVRQLAARFNMRLEERVGERTRIARDLHDTLLQSFHGLLLRFQSALQLLPDRPLDAKQRLESAIDQAAEAIAESRKTVQGLRTSAVEGRDLGKAIRTVGEELASANAGGETIAFQVQGVGPRRDLRALVHDEVYRIAVEALRNAFQHAGAKRIAVEIHYEPREFRLSISDDGRGIDAQVLQGEGLKGHFGLPGMRERATIIGGRLDVWSSVGEGTEISLTIPGTKAYSGADERPWWSGKLRKEKDESKAAKTTQ